MAGIGQIEATDFVLRPCRIDDCGAIHRLNRDVLGYDFPPDATEQKIRRALASGRDFIAVAECENRVIGYIHAVDYDVLYAPPYKDILALAVSIEHQRSGVGRALLDAVERWAGESGAQGIRLVCRNEHRQMMYFLFFCSHRALLILENSRSKGRGSVSS